MGVKMNKEFEDKLNSMRAGLRSLRKLEQDPEVSRIKFNQIKKAIAEQEAFIRGFEECYSIMKRDKRRQLRLSCRPVVEVGVVQGVLV